MKQTIKTKLLCFLWLAIGFLNNFPIEAQISPGSLSKYHAELDKLKKCTACHEIGQPIVVKRCLTCHTEIQRQFDQKQGYHARIFDTSKNDLCSRCHSEHNGRDFELIYWIDGKENFKHGEFTGYPLEGKHGTTACNNCHQPKYIIKSRIQSDKHLNRDRTYLGLSRECSSCHADPHHNELGNQCIRCHNFSVWSPAMNFDHSLAKFPLTGRHKLVQCIKCHPVTTIKTDDRSVLRFRGIAFSGCDDCHTDPHKGKLGKVCSKCHTTEQWRHIIPEQFDHSKTRYPLMGRHQNTPCQKCHLKGYSFDSKLFDECKDCHADYHQGQFDSRTSGGECSECHTVDGFTPVHFEINDHAATSFPLLDAHQAVPCRNCHKPLIPNRLESTQFKFQSFACIDCHIDIHDGQFQYKGKIRDCNSCHLTTTWHDLLFDHQRTAFPLAGKHLSIQCEKCHPSISANNQGYKVVYKLQKADCVDCHEDIHDGQFISERKANPCQRCHTAESWTLLTFGHNKDTSFPLDGAHNNVPCKQCHKEYVSAKSNKNVIQYAKIPKACKDCHS